MKLVALEPTQGETQTGNKSSYGKEGGFTIESNRTSAGGSSTRRSSF